MMYYYLLIFLALLWGCSDDNRSSDIGDSGYETDALTPVYVDSSLDELDAGDELDSGDSGEQDAKPSDTRNDDQDSSIIDASEEPDSGDADIEDSKNEDVEETDAQEDEEIITDLPTAIFVNNCDDHYANTKRCPEEKCSTQMPQDMNYVPGCPGMEPAHSYICAQSSDPSKGMFVLLCACICIK